MDTLKAVRKIFKKKSWVDDYVVSEAFHDRQITYVHYYPYMKNDFYNEFYLFLCEHLEQKTNMLAVDSPVGRLPLNREMLRVLWYGSNRDFKKAYDRLVNDGVVGLFTIEHTERVFINPAFAFRGKSFPSFLVFLFSEYATDKIYGHSMFNPPNIRNLINSDNRLRKDRRRKGDGREIRLGTN